MATIREWLSDNPNLIIAIGLMVVAAALDVYEIASLNKITIYNYISFILCAIVVYFLFRSKSFYDKLPRTSELLEESNRLMNRPRK